MRGIDMAWQSVEQHILAEWPLLKAFIAVHPYYSVISSFALGTLLGYLV